MEEYGRRAGASVPELFFPSAPGRAYIDPARSNNTARKTSRNKRAVRILLIMRNIPPLSRNVKNPDHFTNHNEAAGPGLSALRSGNEVKGP
jgi:hypothetical protein